MYLSIHSLLPKYVYIKLLSNCRYPDLEIILCTVESYRKVKAKANSFVSGSYKNYQNGAVGNQPTHSGKELQCFLEAESTEWFTEGLAFSPSYYLALPPLFLSFSVFLCVASQACWWEMKRGGNSGGGANSYFGKLVLYKSFNTLWLSVTMHLLMFAKGIHCTLYSTVL